MPSFTVTAATDTREKPVKKQSSSVQGDQSAKFTVFSRNNMAVM